MIGNPGDGMVSVSPPRRVAITRVLVAVAAPVTESRTARRIAGTKDRSHTSVVQSNKTRLLRSAANTHNGRVIDVLGLALASRCRDSRPHAHQNRMPTVIGTIQVGKVPLAAASCTRVSTLNR